MTVPDVELHQDLRSAVGELCRRFPDSYWRDLDREEAYPEEFVRTLTEAGYLAALIPEQYGGSGLGITEAAIILEEVNRSGGNAAACHAQMYIMGTLLRHGSDEQKRQYLPKIANGELRLQAFGVTEPTTGTDTTQLQTMAVRDGDRYIVNGQKVWISRAEYSDLMLLIARTTPREEVAKKTDGLSVFLVDLRSAVGNGVTIRPLRAMMNHATTEVFFDNLEVPAENRVGEEGRGFRYLLDGLNAERILIAAECVGDGRWFIERAVRYANERIVFNRPIGKNQGVQFPIARAHVNVEAADLMRARRPSCSTPGSRAGPRPTWPSCSRPTPRGRRPTWPCRRTAASASPRTTTSSGSSGRLACTRWRRSRRTSFFPTSPSTCSACRAPSDGAAAGLLSTGSRWSPWSRPSRRRSPPGSSPTWARG